MNQFTLKETVYEELTRLRYDEMDGDLEFAYDFILVDLCDWLLEEALSEQV